MLPEGDDQLEKQQQQQETARTDESEMIKSTTTTTNDDGNATGDGEANASNQNIDLDTYMDNLEYNLFGGNIN